MARLLSHSMHGVAKQLLAAGTAAPLQQEALKLGAAACSALRLQFQQACMHSPAAGSAAARSHSYHGSRDDEDSSSSGSSSGKDAAAAQPNSSDEHSSSSPASSQATEQYKALQEAIEQATEAMQAGRHAREASSLPDHVARIAMRDPLGMLMTSRGVPLGISLRLNPDRLRKQQQAAQSEREAEAEKRDWQELLGQHSSSSRHAASEDNSTSVPSTDAQMLRAKLIKTAQKLVNASKASKFNSSKQHMQVTSSSSVAAEVESSTQEQQQEEQQHSGSDSSIASQQEQQEQQQQQRPSVGQQAMLQFEQLLSAADRDSYGTTQQSPAEIAQQIADSNRRAAGGGDGSDGEVGSDDDDEGDEEAEALALAGHEGRFADEASVAAELKEMDEIYEVLAKVPWLSDDDVEERELRGLVAVSLLGTLEEVGWQLREQLLALWAGERDLDALTAGVGAREAAALTAILYHTEQLEREYGGPPAAGVAAAVKAGRGVPASASEAAAAAAMAAVADVAGKAGGEKQ